MEFEIEVGTDDQKLLIIQELEFVKIFAEQLEPPFQLYKVIVASNFDEKINSLEKTTSYKSIRKMGESGINAMARVATLGNGYAIVLSPLLYTEMHDSQTRLFFVLHELHHLLNKRDMSPIPANPFVTNLYLRNLYALYDEYSSDSYAYQLIDQIFPTKSVIWETFMSSSKDGFTKLITDNTCYNHFKKEIEAFRKHADGDLFINNTRHYFDEMATLLVHVFSLFHYCGDKVLEKALHNSKFVNEKTFALMDYLRSKFINKDINLTDGMNLIIGFIENFGYRFEDRDIGYYCHVLDI